MKKLVLLTASLAMLLAVTAALALAQTQSRDADEPRCLLPEGCGPVDEERLLCLLPEGCDTDGDGAPDLGAGEPVPGVDAGAVQYANAP